MQSYPCPLGQMSSRSVPVEGIVKQSIKAMDHQTSCNMVDFQSQLCQSGEIQYTD